MKILSPFISKDFKSLQSLFLSKFVTTVVVFKVSQSVWALQEKYLLVFYKVLDGPVSEHMSDQVIFSM